MYIFLSRKDGPNIGSQVIAWAWINICYIYSLLLNSYMLPKSAGNCFLKKKLAIEVYKANVIFFPKKRKVQTKKNKKS